MARANIPRGALILKRLYAKRFGGKRLGRFTVTNEQLCDALGVAFLQTKTLRLLIDEAREEQGLVLSVTGVRGLYSVVSGRKASAWRRVPRAEFWDTAQEVDPEIGPGSEDEGETEEGDDE
jgi:hypothetical protein